MSMLALFSSAAWSQLPACPGSLPWCAVSTTCPTTATTCTSTAATIGVDRHRGGSVYVTTEQDPGEPDPFVSVNVGRQHAVQLTRDQALALADALLQSAHAMAVTGVSR